jgi:hypothetical protein
MTDNDRAYLDALESPFQRYAESQARWNVHLMTLAKLWWTKSQHERFGTSRSPFDLGIGEDRDD